MHVTKDLGLFLLGRLLEQVGDLGRLQPADARERAAQQGATRMADERLELGPLAERMFVGLAGRAAEAEPPPGPAVRVDSGEDPVAGSLLQLEVGCLDQVRPLYVDQAVPEHVRP